MNEKDAWGNLNNRTINALKRLGFVITSYSIHYTKLYELLKELKNMGKTVFISSHILTELSDFCNKVGIIEAGKMVVSGEVDEILKAVSKGQLVTVIV